MNRNMFNRFLLSGVLGASLHLTGNLYADETSSQVLTPISNSTLSGIVDTSHWLSIGVRYTTVDELPDQNVTMPVPVEISTQPGSFVGTTQPPTAVETAIYFPPTRHSSGGSRSTTPDEVISDRSFPMPGMSGGVDFPIVTVNDITTIPEPSTLALFLGGAGLLAFRMRRKA